ncbi:MAG: hypothetical protein AAGF87_16100 [Bacteroidota bacterium]
MKIVYIIFISSLLGFLIFSCTVGDDDISLLDFDTYNTLCCLDTFTRNISDSSHARVNHQLGDTLQFVSASGTVRKFTVIKDSTGRRESIIWRKSGSLIDSFGYVADLESRRIELYAEELSFHINISISNHAQIEITPMGFKVNDYDRIISSSSRGLLENNFFMLLDRKATVAVPEFLEISEFRSWVVINGQTLRDVYFKPNSDGNQLYFSFGKGVVAFYDPASGEMWARVD